MADGGMTTFEVFDEQMFGAHDVDKAPGCTF